MEWIDMHCDTLWCLAEYRKKGTAASDSLYRNHLCVDVERLGKAGCAAQFFACFVNAGDHPGEEDPKTRTGRRWDGAYRDVLGMLRLAREEEKRMAGADSGVRCVLTVEEGGVLNGEISRLDVLYRMGVRLLTLTWNYENCIGSPNSRDRTVMERGLRGFGIEAVSRMNDLGIIIDVSHLSDGGFRDCIRYSRYPVAASHSNARSLCAHPRNLSDEMLRALGEQGGVAGLNFYAAFLRETKSPSGAWASPDDIAEHAAWMVRKAGEDAVAFGTDFDGFEREALPEGIRGVQDMERVADALRRKGITARQMDKIASGNVKRLIHDVWKK